MQSLIIYHLKKNCSCVCCKKKKKVRYSGYLVLKYIGSLWQCCMNVLESRDHNIHYRNCNDKYIDIST